MPQGELFIQWAVDYAEDEKLSDVSRGARLLYFDASLLCKRIKSDGVLTQRQAERLCHPDSPASARRQIAELVASGAWERRDDGRYVIPAYLKRNKSRAQIDADRRAAEAAAALGNHRRWHVDRGIVDPTCLLCQPQPVPDPPPDRVPDRPPDQPPDIDRSSTDHRSESPEYRVQSTEKGGYVTGERSVAPARATTPTPQTPSHQHKHRCTHHRDLPPDDPGPPCVGCRQARQTAARAATAEQTAEQTRRRACPLCDANGRRFRTLGNPKAPPCDHQPLPDDAPPTTRAATIRDQFRHDHATRKATRT